MPASWSVSSGARNCWRTVRKKRSTLPRPATQLMLSSGVPSCVPHSLCSTRSRAQLIPGRAAEVGMGSVHMERLKQLSELHKSGALTDDEFASKKAEILALAPIGFVEEEPSAEAAPAAPPAKKEEPTTAAMVFGGIVFLIVVAIVVAGIVAIVSNTGDREPEPDPISVSAGVGIVNRGLSLRVSNKDAFPWHDITFYLDGILNGYTYEHPLILAGGIVDIRLSDFVNKRRDSVRPSAPKATRDIHQHISAYGRRTG